MRFVLIASETSCCIGRRGTQSPQLSTTSERKIHDRHIEVGGGLALHAVISGDGPALVMLHGFTGAAENFAELRQVLEKDFTVVAIDLPGHGKSSAPADPDRYRLDRLADDLGSAFDDMDLKRVALFGYSMGGRSALRFALGHSDRITALILESTSPGIKDAQARQARRDSDDNLAGLIENRGVSEFVDYWERLPIWESQNSVQKEKRESLRAHRLLNSAMGLANSLRGAGAGREAPVYPRLKEIQVPTLLIAGSLDRAYVTHATEMQRAIPGAQLRIIEGAGHAVHFEKPAAVASDIRRFLLDSAHHHNGNT